MKNLLSTDPGSPLSSEAIGSFPQGVFHSAALLSGRAEQTPQDFFHVNVIGTLNVLEVCRTYGVRDIVYSSTMGVYGREMKYLPVDEKHPTAPYDFYSLSKLQGEEVCRLYNQAFNLNAIILRYSGVYGLRKPVGAVVTFFQKALDHEMLEISEGISWDIVHVWDVVEANIRAYENAENLRSAVFNIGSGEEISTGRLVEKIVALTRSQSVIQEKHSPSPSFRLYYDISLAKKLLDFTPRTIEQGLETYLEELQKQCASLCTKFKSRSHIFQMKMLNRFSKILSWCLSLER